MYCIVYIPPFPEFHRSFCEGDAEGHQNLRSGRDKAPAIHLTVNLSSKSSEKVPSAEAS